MDLKRQTQFPYYLEMAVETALRMNGRRQRAAGTPPPNDAINSPQL